MYVDRLDLSTVDFTGIGGPPPTHKFVVSAWTINAVKVVLAADKATDTTYGKLQVSSGFFLYTTFLQIFCGITYEKFVMWQPFVVNKR